MTARQVWEDDEPPLISPLAGDVDMLDDGPMLVVDSSVRDGTDEDASFHGRA
jgi:hypothetical protein